MIEPFEPQRNLGIRTDDLKPFINYRNKSDDRVALAIQQAERTLREQGKPLVKD